MRVFKAGLEGPASPKQDHETQPRTHKWMEMKGEGRNYLALQLTCWWSWIGGLHQLLPHWDPVKNTTESMSIRSSI